MNAKFLLAAILLCAEAPLARADYLFTWEGNSNMFQGTFGVTDAEFQSNQFYYSLSLTNSISVTGPDGTNYRWGAGNTYGSDGFGVFSSSPIFRFGIQIYYPQATPQGDYLELDANYNTIQEILLAPGQAGYPIYTENGLWNVTYIPEPSVAALLSLGAAACLVRRKFLLPRSKCL